MTVESDPEAIEVLADARGSHRQPLVVGAIKVDLIVTGPVSDDDLDGLEDKDRPAEFRRRVLDLVEGGRCVADVAADLGISDQTIYNWRRQDRIDRGIEPRLSTGERAELAAAKKRLRELEAEVAVHRRATELLKNDAPPKGGSRPSNR